MGSSGVGLTALEELRFEPIPPGSPVKTFGGGGGCSRIVPKGRVYIAPPGSGGGTGATGVPGIGLADGEGAGTVCDPPVACGSGIGAGGGD